MGAKSSSQIVSFESEWLFKNQFLSICTPTKIFFFEKKWKPAHWWSQCSSKKLKKWVSVFVPGIPNGGKKLFTNFKFWIWMIVDLRIFYFSKNSWKNTGEQMHLFQHSSVFYQLCNRSNGWRFWNSEFFCQNFPLVQS